jgi:hypothetical protein
MARWQFLSGLPSSDANAGKAIHISTEFHFPASFPDSRRESVQKAGTRIEAALLHTELPEVHYTRRNALEVR